MIIRVYDRSTAARILRHWRVIGLTIEMIARGIAWRGRWRFDTHVLTLMIGVRRD